MQPFTTGRPLGLPCGLPQGVNPQGAQASRGSQRAASGCAELAALGHRHTVRAVRALHSVDLVTIVERGARHEQSHIVRAVRAVRCGARKQRGERAPPQAPGPGTGTRRDERSVEDGDEAVLASGAPDAGDDAEGVDRDDGESEEGFGSDAEVGAAADAVGGGAAEFVEIGIVGGPFGTQGEVRVRPITDMPENRLGKPGIRCGLLLFRMESVDGRSGNRARRRQQPREERGAQSARKKGGMEREREREREGVWGGTH
jgi:hypothetical protein